MLADCSRWDAECAGTAAERDGTKSLYPRRTALACSACCLLLELPLPLIYILPVCFLHWSLSSAFPAISLGFTIFGEIFVNVTIFF